MEASNASSETTSTFSEQSTAKTQPLSDASLVKTTRLTWKDAFALRLDPDVADDLIKDAYAFSGDTLHFFARELDVSPRQLSLTIIRHIPRDLDREGLERLMQKLIPALEADLFS